jgi:hypothetical protein
MESQEVRNVSLSRFQTMPLQALYHFKNEDKLELNEIQADL